MAPLDIYSTPETLPANDATRVGRLLGLKRDGPLGDVELADVVASGLRPASAQALGKVIGKSHVVGPLIPEATLRRATKARKSLSREMSERLYEVSRVVDAISRSYHGDKGAVERFLTRPHTLLSGRTPLEMAGSSSAGAQAVMNLIRRADAGVAL